MTDCIVEDSDDSQTLKKLLKKLRNFTIEEAKFHC